MSKRDYYEILGVTRTVTEIDLKIAFRKAAMQCHPDRHPGDPDGGGALQGGQRGLSVPLRSAEALGL